MMQLLIQGLRKEYAAVYKAFSLAYRNDNCDLREMDEACCALHDIFEMLILLSTSYRGMTDVDEIVRNLDLDMRYVTEDGLSLQEEKERVAWHWKRQEELNMANKTTQEP